LGEPVRRFGGMACKRLLGGPAGEIASGRNMPHRGAWGAAGGLHHPRRHAAGPGIGPGAASQQPAGTTGFPGERPDRRAGPARQDYLLQQHRRHLDDQRQRHQAAAPDHQPGARLRPRVVARRPHDRLPLRARRQQRGLRDAGRRLPPAQREPRPPRRLGTRLVAPRPGAVELRRCAGHRVPRVCGPARRIPPAPHPPGPLLRVRRLVARRRQDRLHVPGSRRLRQRPRLQHLRDERPTAAGSGSSPTRRARTGSPPGRRTGQRSPSPAPATTAPTPPRQAAAPPATSGRTTPCT